MSKAKWLGRAYAGAGLVVLLGLGCNPASLSYFLFRGDGKAPAPYPLEPKDGKKEVIVAVVASAPPGVSIELAGLERDLPAAVGRKLAEGSKEAKRPVRVIDPTKVERFKAANPNWNVTVGPAEAARQLGADYLIDLQVGSIGLYQPGSANNYYQGQATVDVVVHEAGADAPKVKFPHQSMQDWKPADTMPKETYRAIYLDRLAAELANKHIPHISDQRIPSPMR